MLDGSSSRTRSRFSVAGFCGGAGLMRTNRQAEHSRASKVPGWRRNPSRAENNTAPDTLEHEGQRSISGSARSSLGAPCCCTVNDEEVWIGRASAVERKCSDSFGADLIASCPTCELRRGFPSSRYPNAPSSMPGVAASAPSARSGTDRDPSGQQLGATQAGQQDRRDEVLKLIDSRPFGQPLSIRQAALTADRTPCDAQSRGEGGLGFSDVL